MHLTPAQRAVLAAGLTDAEPPADADWTALLGWAAEHRLTGLLWNAARASGDAPAEITSAYEHSLRRSLVVEATAVRAITALHDAGIDTLVWKGVANAHADYPDPGMRTFYDVDLLVRRADFARAIEVLTASAGHRAEPRLGRRWEQQFARAAVLSDTGHVEVDLHAAISAGAFGVRFDHEGLFHRAEPFTLGGQPALRPTAPDRLVCTAYALVLSRGGNLRLARDLAQLVEVAGVDPARTASEHPDTAAVVGAAVTATASIIDLPADVADWAARQHPTRSQRRALRWAQDAHGWRTDAVSELSALGWRDRLAYVITMRPKRRR